MPVPASEGRKTHFAAYTLLRINFDQYIREGNQNPTLSLLPRPRGFSVLSSRRNRGINTESEFAGESKPDITDNEPRGNADSDWE